MLKEHKRSAMLLAVNTASEVNVGFHMFVDSFG